MHFTFVRHGQTDWNVQKKAQGVLDIPLNETGRQQAKELAVKMKSMSFDKVYASPLLRAYETAEILVGDRHEITKVDALREIDYGDYAGQTTMTVSGSRLPGTRVYNQKFMTYNPETWAQLLLRIETFIPQLFDDMERGLEVLVVAHGVVRRGLSCLLQIHNRDVIKNAVPYRFRLVDEQWSISEL